MKKRAEIHWFLRVLIYTGTPLLVVSIVIFILPKFLPTRTISNTEVYGVILQNEKWNNTVKVSGDLFALPGVVIKIEPGTKVLISRNGDKSNLDFIPWHLKSGINTHESEHGIDTGEPFWDESQKVQLHFFNLEANGTSNNPIIFSPDTASDSSFDTNLITVTNGLLNNVQMSNYRRFEIGGNVRILNSSFKLSSECGICINDQEPQIENNVFFNNKGPGILVKAASPVISNNKFLDSEGEGVIFNGDSLANIIVTRNFFQMSSKKAIEIYPSEEGGIITGNFFANGNILLPCNSRVVIKQNVIYSQVFFKSAAGCVGSYQFDYNFWGLSKEQDVLNSRIIGVTPTFRVKIPFLLKTPPSNIKGDL